jgi:uncharacterized protein (DUF305 family)
MEKSSWVIGVLLLAVGLGLGYTFGQSKSPEVVVEESNSQTSSGMHVMPDGSVMGGESMSMEDMMEDMAAALEGKTGDDFDQAFLAEMIVHHEGAVEMAELALEHAEHQEIKDLAEAIIEAQNKEIADMKEWQESWYGSSNE